jgi:sulfonate transport system ATP-binding protein
MATTGPTLTLAPPPPAGDDHDLDHSALPGRVVAVLAPRSAERRTLARLVGGLDAPAPPRRVAVIGPVPLDGAAPPAAGVLRVITGPRRDRRWPLDLADADAVRAAVARARLWQPDLLLLDEPYAALAGRARAGTLDAFPALRPGGGPAVVLATGDLDVALGLADRLLVLRNGRITVDLPVPLSRPRDRRSVSHHRLRAHLLGLTDGQEAAPGG